jgi:hypothetical protein
MTHSWENSPSIPLSFKLAFVLPRQSIIALTWKTPYRAYPNIIWIPPKNLEDFECVFLRYSVGSNSKYKIFLILIVYWYASKWDTIPRPSCALRPYASILYSRMSPLLGHPLNFRKFHLYIKSIFYFYNIHKIIIIPSRPNLKNLYFKWKVCIIRL